MGARSILSRGVTSGLRLGRGTADRVVRAAGPPIIELTGTLLGKVRRPRPGTPTTFTPSKRRPAAPATTRPNPATVARNIGPPRPTATQPRAPKPKRGPGAKLPPPRPSTT